MPSLLTQQIAPVDELQARLTQAALTPRIDELMAYFLRLRAEIDTVWAPTLPAVGGQAYPYGRCEEITRELFAHLSQRLALPQDPMDAVLRQFVLDGGVVQSVWGVLRERYFQNAIQFGGLYVDVSNDTVTVTKPKVEILPIAESGLVPVRDLAHFRATAERYWNATIYANHVLPALAPILPMISVSPGKLRPGLQSACDYMIELMCSDAFTQAEQWLRDGPVPPADLEMEHTPADLRPWTITPRDEAVLACQRARAAGCHLDPDWRRARVMDYVRSLRSP